MALAKRKRAVATPPAEDSDSSAIEVSEEEPMAEDAEVEEASPKRPRSGSDEEADSVDEDAKSDDEEKPEGNAGWADAISKVLRTNKPKKKKTLVLSRAKKLNEMTVKDEQEAAPFEIDGQADVPKTEQQEEKPDVKPILSAAEIKEQKKKRKMWETMSRKKPDVLAKDREKMLSKVATKGVIQLFNAVRKQQKDIEGELEEAGFSERKREKVLKSVDKNSFLDILMGPTKSIRVGREKKDTKDEADGDDKTPLWSVLRDDFMMGDGKLKDWDKEGESDDGGSGDDVESIGDDDGDSS